MAEIPGIGRDSISAQADLARRAKKEHAITPATIEAKSPLKAGTVKTWFTGRPAMPLWAIGVLHSADVPVHLLSIPLQPFGLCLEETDSEPVDWDDLANTCLELAAKIGMARAERGPGKTAIVHQEAAELREIAGRLGTLARRAARGA